uniref:Helicase ATP-binding domain-containing protein n=1 Tax=Angiostrongylus cantonensis TaxID=6313 RepID=A0A0K0DJU2_ANGCA
MKTTCFVTRTLREFSSRSRIAKLNSDSFGSLCPSDVRIERLSWPKTHDFETTAPVRSAKKLEVPLSLSKRKREQLLKLQAREPPPANDRCLIECSRREFNLHESQLGRLTLLCSRFWEKNKYSDDWFVIKRRSKVSNQFVKWENTWETYVPDRLHPMVKSALEELGLKSPTFIQSQCLKAFLSTHHLFIAAETGSGKTIAAGYQPFVKIPLYFDQEGPLGIQPKFSGKVPPKCPRSIAGQMDDWDVLVGTPGLMEKCLRKSKYLCDVEHLVLDEADMLLDDSFTSVLTEIFSFIPITNSITNTGFTSIGARVIFCSATCPEQLESLADGVVDRQFLHYIRSPRLHSLLHNLELKFIRVREKDKIARLKELLTADMRLGKLNETMVFCKNRATASFVHKQLQSFEYEVVLWSSLNNDHEKTARILVATDGAARQVH